MRYKVIKLTVGRKELYDHYKKNSELVAERAVTDEVNSVDDRLALAEMIDKILERTGADENCRADESKGTDTEGCDVCEVLVGQSA
jgi:uncharacterized protein YdaT